MASETQPPDAVLDSTNYSSLALADIDEDPDAPDGAWGTSDGNGDTTCRVSFGTPSGNPTVGADLQEFRVLIRKSASGGNDTPWSLELWENGSLVSVLNAGTTTSLTGEVVSGTWNAASLATSDGSLVECLLVQTDGGTGNPGNRRFVEVGAVEWNVQYTAAQPEISGAVTVTSSVAAALSHGVTIDGGLTVTPTASAELAHGVVLDGAVSVSTAIGAAFAVGRSLDGAVSVPVTPASTFAHGVTIDGSLTVSETITASLEFTGSAEINGDVTVTPSITTAFAHGVAIDGGLTVTPAVAAGLARGAVVDGDISISTAIAAGFVVGRQFTGATTVPLAVGAAIAIGRTIDGAVAVGNTIASTLEYAGSSAITGNIPVGLSIDGSVEYSTTTLRVLTPTKLIVIPNNRSSLVAIKPSSRLSSTFGAQEFQGVI